MASNIESSNYSERVVPSLSYFIAGLVIPMISGLIALPFVDELLWLVPTITYGTYVGIGLYLAPRVVITNDSLTVGKATIPRQFVGLTRDIPVAERFAERGSKLDPKAYIRFQVGVAGLVKVEIKDPEDPTPYWLFATRNPDLVTAYLNRAY
jgi:hypothetical protein